MAHDAFISYSKKDKEIADAICKALETDGLSCWYAPRDVEIGADWDASIMEALANSRVMILVWSSNSDSSRQVKRELAIAIDDIGVSLIPFRTEIIEPSKLRYYLRNIQWLDASTPPLENNLRLLIKEVRTVIARISNTSESARELPPPTEETAADIAAAELERKQRKESSERRQDRPAGSLSSGANTEGRPAFIPEAQVPSPAPPPSLLMGSYGTRATEAFPFRRVLIAVGALVVVVAGLAYAFWPTANDEQDQTTMGDIVSNEVPSPALPTPVPLASEDSNVNAPQAESSPTPPRFPISGGVLNSKALSLPKPEYPPIARAANVSGTVVVQVTIDEDGRVISAQAVSGHPLLQGVSEAAARRAMFSPTILSGQRVKVTGVINYHFAHRRLTPVPLPSPR